MEKRFLVEIEYLNTNRRKQLVLWAVDIEEAMNLALNGGDIQQHIKTLLLNMLDI